ncbi:MAG: class I SAM-dependent methyltransferase [Cyanobacteria bacterium P01_A01_bin.135]
MPSHSALPDNPLPKAVNAALLEQLVAHIQQQPQQRIPFAEYMAWVLYHPQHGYYTSRIPIGEQGDYITSSSYGADFGELLAAQFVQLWQGLDCPDEFTLVEQGAGQGLLAADILVYLKQHHPEFFDVLTYRIVERSPRLGADQQQRLAVALPGWDGVQWCAWSEIPKESLTGCIFANELVDAFPVHRVQVQAGALQEIYVAIAEVATVATNDMAASDAMTPPFVEQVADCSTPALREYFRRLDIPIETYPDGYTTEVNLAALDWLAEVAGHLRQGYLITIDYGYPAERYYQPTRSGTLQCYYQHHHHSDPYQNLGHQDITAHVDFTTLQAAGQRCGLETVGFTQQGLFLMALGMGDRLNELSEGDRSVNQIIQRREALHALISPMGLGNFGVLVQGKGLPSSAPLPRGLQVPNWGQALA